MLNSTFGVDNQRIPFNVPAIDEDEVAAIVHTLESKWLTTGPKTREFETQFARYLDVPYAVAVNSCTAALHLSLVAYGIGPGDEVITTPYTFAATGEVILQVGARPIFVDILPDGFNIDPEKIQVAITNRTKAIIPVHFAGEPCRMDQILDLAKRHNLVVIEDAAHALGAAYHNKPIGTLSHATAFSFYATKNLTTGEGGMVTTADHRIAEKIRSLSLHGLSHDAWKRYSKAGNWYYEICEPGFKYNMTDLAAALGQVQLAKFHRLQSKRQKLAQLYMKAFAGTQEILLPPHPQDSRHAWHLFVIRLQSGDLPAERNRLIDALARMDIGTSVHFIPLHLHPYYRKRFGHQWGDFPQAEKTYISALSLPLYPDLEPTQVERVARVVRTWLSNHQNRNLKNKADYVQKTG